MSAIIIPPNPYYQNQEIQMKKHIARFTLLLLFFLVSCSPGVPQGMITIPMISDSSWSAHNVSIAVEADGDKHIAWSECPPTGDLSAYCRVIYQRTRSGEIGARLIFSSPIHSYYMANIVVLNDGRAVISFNQSVGSNCRARYAIIPNAVTSLPAINTTIPGDAIDSSCMVKPGLTTNGTSVYTIVDNMQSFDLHSYQYRKLLPTADANAATVIAANPSRLVDNNSQLVAQVDALGNLHTAWITQRRESGSPNTTYGIEYANNNGVTGNLSPINIFNDSLSVSNIDMAVESATQAHIVYSLPRSPEDFLWLATVTSGVVSQSQIALTPGLQWNKITPKISNRGLTTALQVIVFTAENTNVGNSQIFYKLTTPGGSPTQLTNTLQPNYFVQVVPFDVGFIAGWRTNSSSSCQGNASYTFLGNTPVTAFTTTGGCISYGQTMQTGLASNSNWVAGTWIDKQSTAAGARLVPWISFNTNTTYIPLISR